MEDNDVDLQQKKRARRRLVGAVFFVSLIALVLPMVMDQEPPQTVQDVEIRIPGQDEKPFSPRLVEAPQELPAATQGDSSQDGHAATVSDAAKSVSAPAPNVTVTDVVRAQSSSDLPAVKTTEKDETKLTQRLEAVSPSDKKAPEKPKDEKRDDGKRAASILAGGAEVPKPMAKAEYVILIGAFSNEGNVRVLKDKLGEMGIRTFTEQLVMADGKKTRVRAGPFPSHEAAEKALARMKTIGVSGVVTSKP